MCVCVNHDKLKCFPSAETSKFLTGVTPFQVFQYGETNNVEDADAGRCGRNFLSRHLTRTDRGAAYKERLVLHSCCHKISRHSLTHLASLNIVQCYHTTTYIDYLL